MTRASGGNGVSREPDWLRDAPPIISETVPRTALPQSPTEPVPAEPFATYSIEECARATVTEREELIPGLPVNRRALIVAPSETGKTWILIELALKAASGRDVFGEFPLKRPYRVLVVCAEDDPEDVKVRVKNLAEGSGIAQADTLDEQGERRLHIVDVAGFWFGDPVACARLDATVARVNPDLLLFDTIGAVADIKDQNKAEDVIRFYRDHVAPLRDNGRRGVYFSHHTNKLAYAHVQATDDAGLIHGSDGYRRIVDAVILARPAREKRRIPKGGTGFLISTNKQRIGRRRGTGQHLVAVYPDQNAVALDKPDHETPVSLVYLGEMSDEDAARTIRRSGAVDKVEATLRAGGDLSRGELAERTGLSDSAIRDALKKLGDNVRKNDGGGRGHKARFQWHEE